MGRPDYAGRPFVALRPDGAPLTLTPYFRLRTVAGAMQAPLGLPRDCVGLWAEGGGPAERLGPGHYRLHGGERLRSSDPDAV